MNAHERGMQAARDEYYAPDFNDVEDIIRAYLEASGMVMVPREPTAWMLESGGACCDEYGCGTSRIREVYEASIAAFPNPLSQANTEGEKA